MAKIEFIHAARENVPQFTETIEVRVWGLAGSTDQAFSIGSGMNIEASGNLWVEIIDSVEGAQVFYTRNFLHVMLDDTPDPSAAIQQLDEMVEKDEGTFGYGNYLPATSVTLSFKKVTYTVNTNEERQAIYRILKISADTGAVWGFVPSGLRSIDILTDEHDPRDSVRFMRDLIDEVTAAQQGKHPDPANFPAGSSEWPFIEQLNQQAYNKISEDYQDAYFEHPPLAAAFDDWLAQIPAGGLILDAGCGTGQPVIVRLLEKGFKAAGSDISPKMLLRARQHFPQVKFTQNSITRTNDHAMFDGVCSFNAMAYLDPIDLLNSIHRLHDALKPGGMLFLFGVDTTPDWRGEPFGCRLNQWMWSWSYGMHALAGLLEEHGYFEVLETRIVYTDPNEAERLAEEEAKQQQAEAEYNQHAAEDPESLLASMPFVKMPLSPSPYGYVVIARRLERARDETAN